MLDMGRLPRRIFFDTNVVGDILKYRVFEEELVNLKRKFQKHHSRKQEDINALRFVFLANTRGSFQFIISKKVVAELSKSQRLDLVRWGFEFLDYSNNFYDFENKGIRLRFGLALLKDKDRMLVIDAINMKCDVFLTMDYKTIWKHRKKITKIKILRPVEFWSILKPYFALFY